MSEHIVTKVGDYIHVQSKFTPEPMNENEILKLIAPYEIPRLRNELKNIVNDCVDIILNCDENCPDDLISCLECRANTIKEKYKDIL